MLRVNAGRSSAYCDGRSRRSFVQIGMAGMASLGLPQILAARAEAEGRGIKKHDTSVILLWLDGGPGHMDTYDLKPEAPAEIRGEFQPISTNVPGMEFGELMPELAKRADRLAVRDVAFDQGLEQEL